MADIKQAARWMRDGKKVRHSSYPFMSPWFSSDEVGYIKSDIHCTFSDPSFEISDILAEDWEIAE